MEGKEKEIAWKKRYVAFYDHYFSSVKKRFLLLLYLSTLIFAIFFFSVSISTMAIYNIESEKIPLSPTSQIKQQQFKDSLESIPAILKLPVSLLVFNLYARNDVGTLTRDGKIVSTSLNIDILGHYTDKILLGSVKKVNEFPITISTLHNNNFEF